MTTWCKDRVNKWRHLFRQSLNFPTPNVKQKTPSEMEVPPHYKLFTLLTAFALFTNTDYIASTTQTAYTV